MTAEKKYDSDYLKHKDVTDVILKAFYAVYNALGYGFLEKVYQNALMIELQQSGVAVQAEAPIRVYYRGKAVGEYRADLVVQGCVLVEVKTVQILAAEHVAQLLNYLKATPVEVGMLLNFGPKPEFERRVLSNERKGIHTSS